MEGNMIRRGQKIRILSSSLRDSHQHPNVGDVGYLSNVFFLPAHRLLLVNAFFTSYKGEKPGTRCERKRFFIDLDSPPWIKDAVLKDPKGTLHKICNNPNFCVDITSVYRAFIATSIVSYPGMFSTHGIFPANFLQTKPPDPFGNPFAKPKVKPSKERKEKESAQLPICSVETALDRVSLLDNENEMRAWFHSVRSLVYYALFDFTVRKFGQSRERENLDGPYECRGHIEDSIHTLSRVILRHVKFDPQMGSTAFNDQTKITLAPELLKESTEAKNMFVYSMRRLQAIADLVSERVDIGLIMYANAYYTLGTRSIITKWESEGSLTSILEGKPDLAVRVIINQAVRAVLATANVNSALTKLNVMDSLNLLGSHPNSKLVRDKIQSTINMLKEVTNVDSFASLNRILRSPFLQL
jgi:hypothetical protein